LCVSQLLDLPQPELTQTGREATASKVEQSRL
jgi:hypothetical protein